MSYFVVDPDVVRAAGKQVRDVGDAAVTPHWPDSVPFGHPALQEAAREFTADLSDLWVDKVDELDEIASRLVVSADVYERADSEESVSDG